MSEKLCSFSWTDVTSLPHVPNADMPFLGAYECPVCKARRKCVLWFNRDDPSEIVRAFPHHTKLKSKPLHRDVLWVRKTSPQGLYFWGIKILKKGGA